ncbi:hypothetical protein [Enterovirga rhinocerotis]|uniref:Pentapeptide MXKDX repeat protein n=1 Tax=Enterovirga rhinocerotis TaxID=1339210 RepID=A0A4R7C915_9HYPH|nr:hypothetical protein [Enterovirga rhinocerotis]TDR93815.1 hypothetical protein EV668_1084 [Enterovirga rhinocerotis]
MKKTAPLAAALGLSLGLLAMPAMAQQSATGQSSGGPARDANPGVSTMEPGAAPARKMTKKKVKRSGAKKKAPQQAM